MEQVSQVPGRWGPKGRWEEHLIFSLMLETEAVVQVWGEWGVNHMGSGQRLPWKRLTALPVQWVEWWHPKDMPTS